MCGMNRRQALALLPAAIAAASLGACADSGSGPAPVRWGKENCAYCGMIVDDPRFAAQVRGGPKGKVYKFDDLGDAILWMAKQSFSDDPATEFWVGDSDADASKGGGWLDGRKAWYLSGRKSPMAHNFGAVPDHRDGSIDFAEMRKTILERGSPTQCITPAEGSS